MHEQFSVAVAKFVFTTLILFYELIFIVLLS